MPQFDIAEFVMTLTALLTGVLVHDGAQALAIVRLGDETPRQQGRVTLWPPAHLDLLGVVVMVAQVVLTVLLTKYGFGIGWGRPMPSTPSNFPDRPRLRTVLATLAGPCANLLLAFCFALLYRSGLFPKGDAFQAWMLQILFFNVALCLFNLFVPLYRMDAASLLRDFLPTEAGNTFASLNRWLGLPLLLLLVTSPLTGRYLIPAISAIAVRLVGS